MRRLFFLIVSIFLVTSISAIDTTVEKIYENPEQFEGELVSVVGLVTQFVEGKDNSTSHYLIKGDFGDHIRIVTAEEAPETYKKYKVTGIVYFDQKSRSPFISETGRVEIGLVTHNAADTKSEGGNSYWLLIVIAVAAVISIVMMFISGSKRRATRLETSLGDAKPSPAMGDFQTIKIDTAGEFDKTVKYIPGELKIISGKDKGKVFKIAGYPGKDGNVVTIGRADVRGERKYAHIRIMEQTVSRQQAQIIQNGKKLIVKNISETNLTIVDGVELKTSETAEIKPGSTIKTGEVEFQYIV